MSKSLLLGRASQVGAIFGILYGLSVRLMVEHPFGDAGSGTAGVFAVMSIGFLLVVPFVMGYLTVRPVEAPPWWYRVFAPWVPCIIVVAVSWLVAWEGPICIVMALPVMLVFSSIGGLCTRAGSEHPRVVVPMLLLLPYAVMSLEHGHVSQREIVTTQTETIIKAPVDVVWRHVISVDSIRPEEERPALFTAIGFPRPISAELSHDGVGGVRQAHFEGGVRFVETVTQWEPEHAISFTIRAQPVPTSTLDPHVTIGGPYFDVLQGTYELYPMPEGRVRLVLTSRHRVSTEFNLYAGWWADQVMRSIQKNILYVLQERCEKASVATSA